MNFLLSIKFKFLLLITYILHFIFYAFGYLDIRIALHRDVVDIKVAIILPIILIIIEFSAKLLANKKSTGSKNIFIGTMLLVLCFILALLNFIFVHAAI